MTFFEIYTLGVFLASVLIVYAFMTNKKDLPVHDSMMTPALITVVASSWILVIMLVIKNIKKIRTFK